MLEVHQDGDGLSGDVPAAYPQTEVFLCSLLFPGAEQGGIFQEIRVLRPVHPYVRAYEDMMPTKLCLNVQSFGGNNCVDAAYLIANFPAYFKEVVRLKNLVFH